jgi:hypothetical protein
MLIHNWSPNQAKPASVDSLEAKEEDLDEGGFSLVTGLFNETAG